MTTTTNAKNLRLYKKRFPLIVEQKMVFVSSANFAREVKNLPPNFERIVG